jgi:hypothetical protein
MWQPIETAPRDGAAIAVARGRHVMAVVQWLTPEANDVDEAGWYISDDHNDPIWYRGHLYLTSWMPLPEPPK